MKRLSAYRQTIVDALDAAAAEIGCVGRFDTSGKTHDKYRVVLPDHSVVTVPIYRSPKGTAEDNAFDAAKRLKGAIFRNLERRGEV